jgi:hypothetical protein
MLAFPPRGSRDVAEVVVMMNTWRVVAVRRCGHHGFSLQIKDGTTLLIERAIFLVKNYRSLDILKECRLKLPI